MGRFKKVPSKTRGLKASTHLDDTWSYHGNYEKIKELELDLQLAARQIIELERDFNKLAQYIIDEKYKIS
jgi:hypothetical protein